MDHSIRATWLVTAQPQANRWDGDNLNEEFPWMHARMAVWQLSQSHHLTVAPSPTLPPELHDGVWQAVIDLLMYGNGWVDLAGELRQWRKNSYSPTNDILRFVSRNFADILLPLETYFAVYAEVNRHIAAYLIATESPFEVDNLVAERPEANTEQLIRVCRELNLDRAHVAFRLVDALPDSLRESHDVDPLHIASHFTFNSSSGVPLPDSLDYFAKTSPAAGFAVFPKYAHWYRKAMFITDMWLDDLAQLSSDDSDADSDVHLDVHIEGIGYLGRFTPDSPYGRLCRVALNERSHAMDGDSSLSSATAQVSSRTAINSTVSAPTEFRSPRFGIPITKEMHEALEYGLQVDGEDESLEVTARHEVRLGLALVWHAPGQADSWSRLNGQWVPGWIVLEGPHFQACLTAMASGGHLDLSVALEEAMIDDSLCLEDTQPWAAGMLLAAWDTLTIFPQILAEIGQLGERDEVGQGTLKREQLEQIRTVYDNAKLHRRSDIPMAEVADIADLLADPKRTIAARYLLEALVMLCAGEGWPRFSDE